MKNDHGQRKESNSVAESTYDSSSATSHSEAEKGLAITHEQVNDVYAEGTNEVDQSEIPIQTS